MTFPFPTFAPDPNIPLQLSTACALWSRSDRGTFTTNGGSTPSGNGDAVGQWDDLSGNSRHWTQATSGSRPTLQGNVVNGHPVVRFDGSNDSLTGPNLSSLTAAEMFIVIKVDADPPANADQSGIWDFGTAPTASVYPYTDGIIYDGFGTTVRKTVGNPTPSLASWRLYNVISVSGEWTANLDGTQIFTTASNAVGFKTSTVLGSNSIPQYLDGDIAEVILYGAKLSAGDRTKLKAYIANRYGLTIA